MRADGQAIGPVLPSTGSSPDCCGPIPAASTSMAATSSFTAGSFGRLRANRRILVHIVAADQVSHAQSCRCCAAICADGCARKVWVRSILDASGSNSKQQNMMQSFKKACCLEPKDRMEAQEATHLKEEHVSNNCNRTLARSQGPGFTLVSNELRAHHPRSGSGSSDYAAEFGNDYYRLSAPAGLFGNVEGQGDTRPQRRLDG